MGSSRFFSRLVRGIAHHRHALLKDGGTRVFYPTRGTPWTPSRREQSLSDAYIFFVAAELECYFEAVLGDLVDFHEKFSLSSPSSALRSHDKMHAEIIFIKQKLAKNNNTSWRKIEEFWKFLAISKEAFPGDFWDKVDAITTYRGDVAHQSWGIRTFTDPRIIFNHVQQLLPLINLFDRDFVNCRSRQENLLVSVTSYNVEFIPGLGSISTT